MYRIILLITSIFLAGSTIAQQTISLDNILSAIRQNNPAMRMYDADIRSMDEAAKGAKSWMPPELGTGLFMTPYNPSMWKKQPGGMNGMGSYMISAQQMFPNKKEQQANEQYMQAMSSVDKEMKVSTLNELYTKAKRSYYNLLVANNKMKVLAYNQELLNIVIKSAELRYKNNPGKIGAYYKAKAELGKVDISITGLENEVAQQKVILNTLMNRNKLTDFTIDTTYRLESFDTGSYDSSYFLTTRSDIKALDRNKELLQLQQKLEHEKLKPQFGIKYDHMFGFGGNPMQYSLMAMVKLPLAGWSSKMSKANIESLNWKSKAYDMQKEMIVNEATGMYNGLVKTLASRKKQLALYEQNIIPALQNNFKTIHLAYEQNTEDLAALLEAWITLNMTQMETQDNLLEVLLMQVEIENVLEQELEIRN